jgi:heat-inducible transcriptional repressor
MAIRLTERQQRILARVVQGYVETGEPVGSKTLVTRAQLGVSSSTVRNDLAGLEALGLLTHPYTSAGRVPTEEGYRLYAETLIGELEPRPVAFPLDLASVHQEVEAAFRATTEVLSQVTRLLALVSAPSLETTTVRHVEVLLLQPQILMVVVITSTGGVTKRLFAFDSPVDPGLAKWAGEYLNERVAGLQLGTHMLRQRFEDPGLRAAERGFLAQLRPAFTELLDQMRQQVFIGGAAGLLGDARGAELEACQRLLEVLEERAALLEVLGVVLDPRRPFVRVGSDLEQSGLHDVALVGAAYGLANRTLGAVSLVGPVRMDYDHAIRTVRSAAFALSRFVEEVYAEN